ncbi:chitin deacetylase [Moniliophthora roreri MCA 2997]|uniref:Chitin deacetylase n=1 Tax=Moniliophthora roreri (strain MCA 2997) TaxID=1381753 RepID=V2X703_MONRO|nr:chitin deacetylase [Moniliophthora roreri MCA 2997]
MPSHARSPSGNTLSEEYIQDCFHSYLKSSLTQAKVERLLDADILSSAEGDLMITGPALCLYFAALRCTTNPPSVPLPRRNKTSAPMELSAENCPPAFQSFLQVWARTVPSIQSLAPEHQHDLARIICKLEPVSSPPSTVHGIAADLHAVAIEISQRRSFQDRYASDLQAALDSGNAPSSPGAKKASFVPPPSYNDASPSSSAQSSPHLASAALPPPSPRMVTSHDIPPQSPSHLSPFTPGSSSGWPSRSHSPTILSPTSPAIEFIRETLYAALGDVLERQPSLRRMLKRDPPRAYFALVAFAVLDVATTSMTPDGSVVGVLGTPLSLDDCPPELRPFMMELAHISRLAKELEEEDNKIALEYAQRGEDIPPTKMDRIRAILEHGVGGEQRIREEEQGRVSPLGKAVAFTNRINGLSLGMTTLRAFRERQDLVFQILASIGS